MTNSNQDQMEYSLGHQKLHSPALENHVDDAIFCEFFISKTQIKIFLRITFVTQLLALFSLRNYLCFFITRLLPLPQHTANYM